MTSKLKYAALFFGSIGYLMKLTNTELDLGAVTIQANVILTIALLLVAVYAAAKFLGK